MGLAYDQQYAEWLHIIRKAELDNILQVVGAQSMGRVLEPGCGDGSQSSLLKERSQFLLSTDYRSDALPKHERKVLKFLVCDVDRLPFRGSTFDVIFSSNLLEHVEYVDRALTEMSACLRDGGMMIHTVPNVTWKIVQLLLFYPFIVWRGISALLSARPPRPIQNVTDATIRFESNVKSVPENRGVMTWLSRKLIPPIHGAAKSHLAEICRFSRSYWERVFSRNNLEIHARVKMPFYSPYGFGSEHLRRLLQATGLCSSWGYILVVATETRK